MLGRLPKLRKLEVYGGGCRGFAEAAVFEASQQQLAGVIRNLTRLEVRVRLVLLLVLFLLVLLLMLLVLLVSWACGSWYRARLVQESQCGGAKHFSIRNKHLAI